MYWSIVIKLIIGMIGILLFLRMTGKTQMANLTPFDTVNSIVLGALVGSIIYMPDTRVWVFVFAMTIWFILNILVRLLLRLNFFSKLIHGEPETLIKDGKIDLKMMKKNNLGIDQFRAVLWESEVYSLLDVNKVVFETDGKFTIIKKRSGIESYLLISNGEIVEKELEECGYDEKWLKKNLNELGFEKYENIFCAEYTPKRGFYIIDTDGKIMNKNNETDMNKINEINVKNEE